MKIFSKETYVSRRRRLKQKIGKGVLLFLGNEESSINFKDNWYSFRQDSSFLYFFGLDIPGLTAIIDIDEDREIIFGDDLSTVETIWQGSHIPISDLAESIGVESVRSTMEITNFFKDQDGRKIHFLPAFRPENKQKLSQWLKVSVLAIQQLASHEFIKAVVALRSIKSCEEIIEIEKAVNTSVAIHKAVMQQAQPGMKEYELVGLIQGKAIAAGGNLSFPPILTIQGQILHNHNYSHTLTEGKMLLCDFGAENDMHYSGDITRTFPVGSKFSDAQKVIYQIVRNAHQAAIDALMPGRRFLDIHLLACRKLADGLKDMGLMKGNLDDAVSQGAHALFFQCGLGHMMGLDVHDMEDLGEEYVGYTEKLTKSNQFGLKSLRLGKELEQGYVLTIEPGIYFIPQLIDQWQLENRHRDFIDYHNLKKFRDFGGIRIEDGLLITDNGSQLLGNPLEVEIHELEEVRSGLGARL